MRILLPAASSRGNLLEAVNPGHELNRGHGAMLISTVSKLDDHTS